MATRLRVGERAPDFALRTNQGTLLRLSEFTGKKWVVLYFYPKDDTPGCTVEACTFRDQYQDFLDAGAEVLGISSDDEASHKKFVEKYRLPFPLLSDPDGTVRKRYGATDLLGLLPGRQTFVIDLEGYVRYVFASHTRVRDHVRNALELLQKHKPNHSG